MVASGRVNANRFTSASTDALGSPERWDWSGTTSASSDQTYLTTLGSPLVRVGLRSTQVEKRPKWWDFRRGVVEDIEIGTSTPDAADITASLPTASGQTQPIQIVDILPTTDADFPLYELSSTPRPRGTITLPGTPYGSPGISKSATLGTRVLNGRGRRILEEVKSMGVAERSASAE